MILVLIFDVVDVDSELHIQGVQRDTKTIRRFDAFIYRLFVFALFFLFGRVSCRITLPFAVSVRSPYVLWVANRRFWSKPLCRCWAGSDLSRPAFIEHLPEQRRVRRCWLVDQIFCVLVVLGSTVPQG